MDFIEQVKRIAASYGYREVEMSPPKKAVRGFTPAQMTMTFIDRFNVSWKGFTCSSFMADHSDSLNPPMLGGIYLFKVVDEIVYIGKSAQLQMRIKNHLRGGSTSALNGVIDKITSVQYATLRDSDMVIMEMYLISKYKPCLNRDSVPVNDSTIRIEEPEFTEVNAWERFVC